MATLIIQSKEDIIKAYFRNLGFEENKLQEIAVIFGSRLETPQKNAIELVNFLDRQTALIAKEVFPNTLLPQQQLVALFKLVFLQCEGAKFCSADIIRKRKLPKELCSIMQKSSIETTPQYLISDMKPQKIIAPRPAKILKKLWQRKKWK